MFVNIRLCTDTANLAQRLALGVNTAVSHCQELNPEKRIKKHNWKWIPIKHYLGKALSGCTRAGNSCKAGVFHTLYPILAHSAVILSVSYRVSRGFADHCTLLNSLKTLNASWKELRATAGGNTICRYTALCMHGEGECHCGWFKLHGNVV